MFRDDPLDDSLIVSLEEQSVTTRSQDRFRTHVPLKHSRSILASVTWWKPQNLQMRNGCSRSLLPFSSSSLHHTSEDKSSINEKQLSHWMMQTPQTKLIQINSICCSIYHCKVIPSQCIDVLSRSGVEKGSFDCWQETFGHNKTTSFIQPALFQLETNRPFVHSNPCRFGLEQRNRTTRNATMEDGDGGN